MDLRRLALVVGVTGVLGSLKSGWTALQRMAGLGITGSHWWIFPGMVLTLCFTAIMPIFYFELSRDEGTMRFPRELRKIALAAAVACAIVTAVRLQEFTGSWNWSTGLAVLANACYILMLLHMSRELPNASPGQAPATDLLIGITKLAVVVWAVWVAFQFVRIGGVALTYSEVKQVAFQVGAPAPSLRDMIFDVVLTFFSQASLLVAPFIVWRSGFGRRAVD